MPLPMILCSVSVRALPASGAATPGPAEGQLWSLSGSSNEWSRGVVAPCGRRYLGISYRAIVSDVVRWPSVGVRVPGTVGTLGSCTLPFADGPLASFREQAAMCSQQLGSGPGMSHDWLFSSASYWCRDQTKKETLLRGFGKRVPSLIKGNLTWLHSWINPPSSPPSGLYLEGE